MKLLGQIVPVVERIPSSSSFLLPMQQSSIFSENQFPILELPQPPTSSNNKMEALKILKIRKKKMNKQKWKKRNRMVRNSKRYNKNKRSGEQRKKQE